MDESAVLERDGDADESINKVDVSDLTEFEISKAYSGYLDEDKDRWDKRLLIIISKDK